MIRKIEFYLPLLLLAIGTILSLLTDLDLEVAKLFYNLETKDWFLRNSQIVQIGNRIGPKLAMSFALLAGIGLVLSMANPKLVKHRPFLLFIFLCYLIGPALIVNGILKDSWNRPRPREIVEFNGYYDFVKVLVPGSREFKGKSFPSGHASAGFVLVLFYFLYKKRSGKRALFALLIALAYGIFLSLVRIASGAHFFSDNLWAFGFCWFVAYFLYYHWYLGYLDKPKRVFKASVKRWWMLVIGLSIATLVGFLPFLLSDDFYDKYPLLVVPMDQDIKVVEINGYVKRGNAHLYSFDRKGAFGIKSRAHGRAFPGIDIRQDYELRREGDTLYITLKIEPKGYSLRYQNHNNIRIHKDIAVVWDLKTFDGFSKFHRGNYKLK